MTEYVLAEAYVYLLHTFFKDNLTKFTIQCFKSSEFHYDLLCVVVILSIENIIFFLQLVDLNLFSNS